MASSTTLLSPTTSKLPTPSPLKPKSTTTTTTTTITASTISSQNRRHFLSLASSSIVSTAGLLLPIITASPAAFAASDDEYVSDTKFVINKVRNTITLEKGDPNVANAVAELREASISWVAKYRKEKALLGRASFRDIYSAINAVSGHYISFGPTAPIPGKRRSRILEEMDTAEKALLRGR